MTVYYSIGAVLDRVETAKIKDCLGILIDVGTTPSSREHNSEDLFQLSNHPRLINFRDIDAARKMAELLQNVPLYAINLELALDKALSARNDPRIETALRKAFDPQPLPSSLHETKPGTEGQTLRHPILAELPKIRLCELYISFLKALAPFHSRDYNFESDILGKHNERFLEYFDGFISPQNSKVKASILLAFGIRVDHDPSRPLESYVSAGLKKAAKMHITDPMEMVWAWLEADHHQMRHCHDLDRTLGLNGLPRRPNWVRYDVFSLLEKEAIKQYLAEKIVSSHATPTLLAAFPKIHKAIQANAEGRIDDLLQQLLSQTLNIESHYSGSALRFAQSAEARAKEAHALPPR